MALRIANAGLEIATLVSGEKAQVTAVQGAALTTQTDVKAQATRASADALYTYPAGPPAAATRVAADILSTHAFPGSATFGADAVLDNVNNSDFLSGAYTTLVMRIFVPANARIDHVIAWQYQYSGTVAANMRAVVLSSKGPTTVQQTHQPDRVLGVSEAVLCADPGGATNNYAERKFALSTPVEVNRGWVWVMLVAETPFTGRWAQILQAHNVYQNGVSWSGYPTMPTAGQTITPTADSNTFFGLAFKIACSWAEDDYATDAELVRSVDMDDPSVFYNQSVDLSEGLLVQKVTLPDGYLHWVHPTLNNLFYTRFRIVVYSDTGSGPGTLVTQSVLSQGLQYGLSRNWPSYATPFVRGGPPITAGSYYVGFLVEETVDDVGDFYPDFYANTGAKWFFAPYTFGADGLPPSTFPTPTFSGTDEEVAHWMIGMRATDVPADAFTGGSGPGPGPGAQRPIIMIL